MPVVFEKPPRRVNLIYEGTGVRFRPAEDEKEKSGAALPILLAMFAVAASADYYFQIYLPANAPSRLRAASQRPVEKKAETAAPSVSVPAPLPTSVAQPEGMETTGTIVRFGLFINRENAERLAQNLQKNDIFADVKSVVRPMNAYTLKVWPIAENTLFEKVTAELGKNGVPIRQLPKLEHLLAGPIWSKEEAMEAAKKARLLGLHTEVEQEEARKEVFEVVSLPLDNPSVAEYKINEWRNKGFEGVIEK